MSGSSAVPKTSDCSGSRSGVYGSLRTAAPGNMPGSRWYPSAWTDRSGHLWLFGGGGFDAEGTGGDLNDLWVYEMPAATPTFNIASGTYSSPQSVTISVKTKNATIYYTTDGKTTPTTRSTKFTAPIKVNTTET